MIASLPRILLTKWVFLVLTGPALCAAAGDKDVRDIDLERMDVLRQEIARHDDLYFRQGSPEMADSQYDLLVRELAQLENRWNASRDDALSEPEVPDDFTGRFPESPHRVPMLSLRKGYDRGDWEAFHEQVSELAGGESPAFLLEPKLDGMAISLVYEQGRLIRALSRGNGERGEDLTANVLAMNCLPMELKTDRNHPIPGFLELRGEIHMFREDFDELNAQRQRSGEKAYVDPRSAAVGSIRLDDSSEVAGRNLQLAVFDWGGWEPPGSKPLSQTDFRDWLEYQGIPFLEDFQVLQGKDRLWLAIGEMLSGRAGEGIPVDGVVVKINDTRLRSMLGSTARFPRWSIACKQRGRGKTTTVAGIEFSLGATGLLTPVLLVEPIMLEGRSVSRASLYSAGYLESLDVAPGDTVRINLGGNAIPVVSEILVRAKEGRAPVAIPRACPRCGSPTSRDAGGSRLYCRSPDCRKGNG